MKHFAEYRNEETVKSLIGEINRITTRDHVIMEICGGQTHSIVKYNLEELLPPSIQLVHGPGCPVCVTPVSIIDKAIELSLRKEVIFTSFGDMMRVPGTSKDLLTARAEGGDIRMVYSPLDAVLIAEKNPDKQVVFFSVGFETTAPVNALAVLEAQRKKLSNFSLLASQVTVPAAIHFLLASKQNKVEGFLAAGHVCTIMGYHEYLSIPSKYKAPIVVTGFEPVDLLFGLLKCIKQLEEGRYELKNAYTRMVTEQGNVKAQNDLYKVFEPCDQEWRGIGTIAQSGLRMRAAFDNFNALKKFEFTNTPVVQKENVCISGEIMMGIKKPFECAAFGKTCVPENPLGAPMVSSEGACAAYHRYKKFTIV